MGVENPGLRKLQLFVPDDGAIGARFGYVPASARFHRIDDDDSVVTLGNRVAADFLARRIVAMVAHDRQIDGLHHGRAALHAAANADRALALFRGGRRIAGKVVADMLVPLGKDAIVAVHAPADVDDQNSTCS